MTETDKIEINNLLNSMKEMNDYAKKTNETYIDEKILNFAKEAKNDYLNNKAYIKSIIQNNLNLFFDLDNLRVSTSGACCSGYYAMRGEKFCLSIGEGITVVCRMVDAEVTKNTGYEVFFYVRDMAILDIYYHTSDTSDNRYNTCSAWDLVDNPHGNVAKTPKNTSEWKSLYGLATWTRAKNVLLVKQFKAAMTEKIGYFRGVANANEKKQTEMKNVSAVYVKVDL